VSFIKYIQERRKGIRDEVARRARTEAEQRGKRPTYAPPHPRAQRRYWK
jgi:hypothetical protein